MTGFTGWVPPGSTPACILSIRFILSPKKPFTPTRRWAAGSVFPIPTEPASLCPWSTAVQPGRGCIGEFQSQPACLTAR